MDTDWTRAIHYELNIKRRTCTTFIPQPLTNSEEFVLKRLRFLPNITKSNCREVRCGCKRRPREHSWDVTTSNEGVWSKEVHTRPAANNAYGYMFNNHARYIRCDIETKADVLAKLVFDVWKVNKPRLIMCISGGAKFFKLSDRLEKEFMKGIIETVLRAGK